jgi:Zn-dependent metalloprotease
MNSRKILATSMILLLISTFVFPMLSLAGQARETANSTAQDPGATTAAKPMKIVERYREGDDRQNHSATKGQTRPLSQKQERPRWVQDAVKLSLEELQIHKEKYGVQDAGAEFRLLEAIKDERGFMDIRLAQMVNEVAVFGGQLIAHLNDQKMGAISGQLFKEARINTVPKIDETQAIETAKAEFKDQGGLAEEPTAKLAILPRQLINKRESGAVLVYIVKVKIAGKGGATDGFSLFINAKNGSLVWRLSDQHYVVGTGISLYSGTVSIQTTPNDDGSFTMNDPVHSDSQVFDAQDGNSNGTEFRGFDNVWGDQSRETAAVDAHFGVAQSWDYFYTHYDRLGADGDGTPITTFVHYRPDPSTPWNNASG